MTQTIDQILAERGRRYGSFAGHAFITQDIKEAMKSHVGWDDLDPDMVECLEMVAHKIGRIINGDPHYVDSWTDIIGYTRLVEKRLIAEQAEPEPELKDAESEATGNPLTDAFIQAMKEAAKGTDQPSEARHPKAADKSANFDEIESALVALVKAGVLRRVD